MSTCIFAQETPKTEPAVQPAAQQAVQEAIPGKEPASKNPKEAHKEDFENFENQATFMDLSDAIRSKQYVHRAILSAVVKETSRIQLGKWYLNHMTAFGAIFQRAGAYTKYFSGVQNLSFGYVFPKGHGVEIGLDFSNVSSVFTGYRYFLRPKNFMLWGFAGAGLGYEMSFVKFADGPRESLTYSGTKGMAFTTIGLLVPVVDVALKAEARVHFYGMDRLVFVSGIGLILFL